VNNRYRSLAISNPTELRFGVAFKPRKTRHGLIIGGGVVYPKVNFALPPMTENPSSARTESTHDAVSPG
jgi:methanol---5-hydroxybenzimidazolylcobamide Co-methyltransferase